jgi:DNA-directed RNA polymerase specialized sigma24 family protein
MANGKRQGPLVRRFVAVGRPADIFIAVGDTLDESWFWSEESLRLRLSLDLFRWAAVKMAEDGSISRWLGPLQEGDPEAAHRLWERYFVSLVQLARKRMKQTMGVADEEDVALSAFDSFCRHAEGGRFPRLLNRDDLWRLLAVLTARKARGLIRSETRIKRGGKARPVGDDDEVALLEQVFSREPAPELAAQMTEEYQRLLALLDAEDLRRVAIWRMEGHSVENIAASLGCAPRTVKRKLQVIRNLWEHECRS